MTSELAKNLQNLDAFWSSMAHSPELKSEQIKEQKSERELKIHTNWPNKAWQADFGLDYSEKAHPIPAGKSRVTILKPAEHSSEQVKMSLQAMVLPLDEAHFNGSSQVEVLTQPDDLPSWAQACSNAFGYNIAPEALLPFLSNSNATLFSYKVDGKIAGTAIAFQSDDVMGVHQVGVDPNFRGQGIAKTLMHHLVDFAKRQDTRLMTLQASKAGLPLYQQMGFSLLAEVYHLEPRLAI
ncbi:GNAT family N-acetyltransferase [Pseudoalteromonas sp. SS15]|uniref:GNAT family N-acetyltransferase n=1 Tax=Pseudoalteromonas sp. SS15 TaxID=3139393 RepID=UPI003BA9F58E